MDEAIDTFVAFTGASPDVARRYLEMTENISEQAIQLYFDSPDLASGIGQSTSSAPPIPSSTRTQPRATSVGKEDSRGVVHLDDDDEDMVDVDDEDEEQATSAAAIGRAADYEDDEAIARRMQEELYAGGDAASSLGADGVRAPIGRTTETLVGGPGGAWGPEDMQTAVEQQMRLRQARASGMNAPTGWSPLVNTDFCRTARRLQPKTSPLDLG